MQGYLCFESGSRCKWTGLGLWPLVSVFDRWGLGVEVGLSASWWVWSDGWKSVLSALIVSVNMRKGGKLQRGGYGSFIPSSDPLRILRPFLGLLGASIAFSGTELGLFNSSGGSCFFDDICNASMGNAWPANFLTQSDIANLVGYGANIRGLNYLHLSWSRSMIVECCREVRTRSEPPAHA